jgi:hypothetical protein
MLGKNKNVETEAEPNYASRKATFKTKRNRNSTLEDAMRIDKFSELSLALVTSVAMVLGCVLIGAGTASEAYSQSLLAGDITGTVLDPGGSAVTGATVTAKSKTTEATASVKTDAQGAYRFALLKPGAYQVSVKADGFKEESVEVVVSLGQVATVPLHLNVGSEAQTVEVTETAQLLQPDSAELNTSFSYEQLQSVPNPGGDITYVAQTSPGVVMNTAGGDGNFSVFGLPGTSNNFTMNGMEVNDPFLNLNNSGPSNLLLGLNDVAEVNVVTNAYGAQMGSFGGAQVNAISRSGGNAFHGNANYWWNGRAMNANDWFNAGNPKPFSNSNQYSAAVGGPIKRDHTFFFANWEQLSFITAPVQVVLLPSASYEAGVLGSDGNCDNSTSSLYAAGAGGECAFYTNAFSLYNGTANHANATVFSPDQLQLTVTPKTILNEHLFTARIDQSFSDNDKIFGHYKYDKGTQPTATDLINPVFNANSVQPDDEGQLSWSHVFSPRVVNQLLLTGSWYGAIFTMTNQAAATAALPEAINFADLDGYFAGLNPNNFAFPEGRNVSQVQFGDDFSYSLGKHTLKAGISFKKDYISDHDVDEFATPLLLVCGSAATCAASAGANANLFGSGISYEAVQNFTTHPDLGLTLYSLGEYVQDDWKPTPNLTLTLGARVERNSNPNCAQNCLSNFGTNFSNYVANVGSAFATTPYSSLIKGGLSSTFPNYERFMVEPRFGFTYSPTFDRNTVLRGGVGFFTDVFPGTVADQELGNPPLDPQFTIYSGGLDPSQSYSSAQQAATLNSVFQKGYASGGSLNSISAADPNFAPPAFITAAAHLQYPTYTEWSLEIQHELPHNNSLQIEYVGNHGYHEPVQNEEANAYENPQAPGGSFPATAPAPAFGYVNEISSTASSSYAGFVASVLHKGKSLNMQFNYTYSHALDEISNGGILVFNANSSITGQIDPYDLRHNYGNADYDTRHYLNGNYLYLLPYFRGPRAVTAGWELSGTMFLHTGLPFSATESDFVAAAGNVGNAGIAQVAPVSGTPSHCGSSAARTACLSAASFPTAGVASALYAPEDRNQFTGPGYFDTDMSLAKSVPLHEGVSVKLGLSAYNLFNHPNFATPVSNVLSSQFGQSLSTVSPPTSIYGAGLGGDASVRILQLTGKFTF